MRNAPQRAQAIAGARLPRRTLHVTGLALLCFGLVLAAMQSAFANTPTIRLFPTTVVEDLKQTGNVARDMETGLQEVIGRLDQQQALYIVSISR